MLKPRLSLPLPNPSHLFWLLALGHALSVIAFWLFACVLGYLSVPALRTIWMYAVVIGVGVALVESLWLAGRAILRIGVLYRGLQYAEPERPLLSPAALYDSYALPTQAEYAGWLSLGLVLALIVTAIGTLQSAMSNLHIGLAVLWLAGFGALGARLRPGLWRWILQLWLRDVPAMNLSSVPHLRYGRQSMISVIVGVVAVACVLGVHLRVWIAWPLLGGYAVLAALIIAAVAWTMARHRRRVGQRLAWLHREVSALSTLSGSWFLEEESSYPSPVQALQALWRRAQQEVDDKQNHALARIAQANRLKARFIAYMTHDLRSPLNSIHGFSQLLSDVRDDSFNRNQAESISMIRQASGELLLLVNNVLNWAKIESGQMRLKRAWIPSVELCNLTVEYAHYLFGADYLRLLRRIEPGLPPLWVDASLIKHVLVHLLLCLSRVSEASQMTMQLSAEYLRALIPSSTLQGKSGHERCILIAFEDSSRRLDLDKHRHFWSATELAKHPKDRRTGGFHLGLTFTQAVVAAHGGQVICRWDDAKGVYLGVALPLRSKSRVA